MSENFVFCENLSTYVNGLLELLQQEPSLRSQQDIGAIEASLKKAVSPQHILGNINLRGEIVTLVN